jgi:predicted Abi (CAAX) family protease
MEVYHAPTVAKELIGQRVRLAWSQNSAVQRDVAAVTVDVQFTPEVEKLRRTTGNLYPERLNGRSRVGPLQSLAGARPQDDVIVTLEQTTLNQRSDGKTELQIEAEPLLETGRYYTLVKILGSVADSSPKFMPKACPGRRPCPSELFRVQHYNRASGKFDGELETVRIPQQPPDRLGVYASTPRQIEQSPAGIAGWYLYGAQDRSGLFTVQAIQPRSLFQLQPQQILAADLGLDGANDPISRQIWRDPKQQRGTLKTILVDSNQPSPAEISATLPEGTRALVMHLFGGRGGQQGERPTMGTVTGHFSYGLATVIRDPFTDELQWQVGYQQIYATNPDGIISGANSWANYMGNLQRGWLGTRPVADAIVKLDLIDQDYDFGGITLSPLAELARQLRIISDRYRTGDGTGVANVTPAASCVQDSNQALFLTIQSIRDQVVASPEIQQWWADHPDDPTIRRFERLIALGDDLQQQLMPLGVVRADWQSNANALSGTQIEQRDFTPVDSTATIRKAISSWRTILPRQVQDELNTLFLRHGATLWFLRTNQVGGRNPDIYPIAPTQALAVWTFPGTDSPIFSILLTRILSALRLPNPSEWGAVGLILVGYGAIALPIGFSQRFLKFRIWPAKPWQYLLLAVRLFLMPALLEEFVFRVLLLPSIRIAGPVWLSWAAFSLILFIVYHPFNAKTFYKAGNPTFFNPVFLVLTGLLGFACTIAYFWIGSLLAIALLHWIVVTVWLTGLGGMAKLHPNQ